MLSAKLVKYITSLSQKKYRTIRQAFVVEGVKSVFEVIKSSYEITHLFSTKPLVESNLDSIHFQLITESELKKISNLTSPNEVLAVCKIPANQLPINLEQNWSIALDEINDPGNLGTIIRLADWFGIENVICSINSVDLYNPKVIQSTKGSFTRVNVIYTELTSLFSTYSGPIIGADLHGNNLYQFKFPTSGILLLGNEANGISETAKRYLTQTLHIPQFSQTQETESLNLAMASAIVLGELFSQKSR
jgi:RNA methyltransferase, TrmH family